MLPACVSPVSLTDRVIVNSAAPLIGNSSPRGASGLWPARAVRRNARLVRTLALGGGIALALSGCGLSTLTSGLGGGVFGGNGQSQQTTGSTGVNEDQLLAAARGVGTYSGTLGEVSSQCPRVRVEAKDNHLTIHEAGMTGDALAVLHRGELTKTARECQVAGPNVTVKYGFSGRVLLGPKGRAGTVTMPIRVSLLNAKRERLTTESMNVETALTIEKPIGYFSAVRTLNFQMPVGSRPGEFEIEIGFDNATRGAPVPPAPLAGRPLLSGGRL